MRNEDVTNIEDRVKETIPFYLEYACLHWHEHLEDVPRSRDLIAKLTAFAETSLLHWFEVLSLVSLTDRTIPAYVERNFTLLLGAHMKRVRWDGPLASRALRDAYRWAAVSVLLQTR